MNTSHRKRKRRRCNVIMSVLARSIIDRLRPIATLSSRFLRRSELWFDLVLDVLRFMSKVLSVSAPSKKRTRDEGVEKQQKSRRALKSSKVEELVQERKAISRGDAIKARTDLVIKSKLKAASSSAINVGKKTEKGSTKQRAKLGNKVREEKPTESSVIYVGHIAHGFYEKQMREFFSQFGEVRRVKLFRSPKTGNSRGYAFIEFTTPEVANVVAEAMNGKL